MDRLVRWLTGENEENETTDWHAIEEAPGFANDRAVVNDAEAYGVTIEPADATPGERYWRVRRVHHLTPQENSGRHHIYLEAKRMDGTRAFGNEVDIQWDGGGTRVHIDKPVGEPGANFPLWKWMVCTVQMSGLKSDRVHNLRTDHPDEPNPDGSASGNTLFHHSFLVEFEETIYQVERGDVEGLVVNGAPGTEVRLFAPGREEPEQTTYTEPDGTFHFFDLNPATYQVEVGDQRLATTVQAGESARLTLEPSLNSSVIEGKVLGGGGLILRLLQDDEVLVQGQLGESGSFRLRNLAPGQYQIQILHPDEEKPLIMSDLLDMNGFDRRSLELQVAQRSEGSIDEQRGLDSYLLFSDPGSEKTRDTIQAISQSIARHGLPFGFNLREASLARRVIQVGEADRFDPVQDEFLREKGIQVETVGGDPETIRARLDELLSPTSDDA